MITIFFKDIKNIYLISDTHFNHKKIGEYCNRPKNWQDIVIENWNTFVKDDDIILHLGDYCFGNKDSVKKLTDKLNGKKYLIRGNHDRRGKKWFEDVGIKVIPSFTYKINGHKFKFSHRPDLNLPKKTFNIHGHWHNKCPFLHETKNYYGLNLSIEVIDYTPIKFSVIYNLLKRLI